MSDPALFLKSRNQCFDLQPASALGDVLLPSECLVFSDFSNPDSVQKSPYPYPNIAYNVLYNGVPYKEYYKQNGNVKDLADENGFVYFKEYDGKLKLFVASDSELKKVSFQLPVENLGLRQVLQKNLTKEQHKRFLFVLRAKENMIPTRFYSGEFPYEVSSYGENLSPRKLSCDVLAIRSSTNPVSVVTDEQYNWDEVGLYKFSKKYSAVDPDRNEYVKDQFQVNITLSASDTVDRFKIRLGEDEFFVSNPANLCLTEEQYNSGFSIYRPEVQNNTDVEGDVTYESALMNISAEYIDQWGSNQTSFSEKYFLKNSE